MVESGQEKRELPKDTVFDLLNHSYRRALLDCLQRHETALTLPDAAEEVACATLDESIQNIDAEKVKRIYISLYHSHLPRLQAHDVVRYSQERDMVALTRLGERLVERVDRVY